MTALSWIYDPGIKRDFIGQDSCETVAIAVLSYPTRSAGNSAPPATQLVPNVREYDNTRYRVGQGNAAHSKGGFPGHRDSND